MVRARSVVRRAAWGLFVTAWVLALIGVTTGAPQPAAADGNEAPNAPAAYRALTAGEDQTCAILANGSVRCWGENAFGGLGQGDTTQRGDGANEMAAALPPVDLGTGRTATAVSAGSGDNCALLDNGTVKCWGQNDHGQLGQGDTNHRGDGPNEMGDNLPPINLGAGRTAIAITAGGGQNCALLDNGTVKCWGWNHRGQLGQGDTANRGDGPNEMGDNLPPINLGTGRTAIAITAGFGHTCALLDTARVKCWGLNLSGQLGQGDTVDRGDGPNEMGDNLPAVSLGTGRTVTAVTAGDSHACALLDNATVKCWGDNPFGQLGLGDGNARGDVAGEMGANLPAVSLGTGRTATGIAAGTAHTCARLDNATVKCWGLGTFGQLGQGDANHRGDGANEMGDNLPPINLGTGRTATAVTAGFGQTCVRLDNASIKCWGENDHGQLGQGDTSNRGDNAGEMGNRLGPVPLAPPGFSGTATDSVTGQPIAGVYIAVLRTSDFGLATTVFADGSGQYTAAVPAGGYFFYMIDPAGGHVAGFSGPPTTYTVTNSTALTANSTMVPTRGAISGTVTDAADGLPIAGVWAVAVGSGGTIAATTVTAANGTYTLSGLAAGSYRVTFVDGSGRTQEYWDNSADYAGATPIAITAANSVTVDAALGYLPPTNDDFDNARTIAGAAGTIDGTNHGATKETGEPNHADNEGGKSVWYQWTAPSTGTFSFDTCGSDYDTVLAAYAGTTVNALSPLGSDDDGCGQGGGGSEISFAATTGTTYRIAVDGFDAGSGNFVLQWGPLLAPPTFLGAWGGSLGDGEFDHPYGSAVDASGNVYVADAGNNRIQKFTATGVFVTQWGTLGAGNGQFDTPWGVAVDGSGNVYVSDLWNARVQRFSSTGTYLSQFGSPGAGNGQFGRPRGVAVDPSGNVYVVDDINDRVQKFSSTGVYLTQWGASGSGDGQFDGAWGIAVDQSSGNVYVTDHSFATNTSRVQKFTATGTYVTQWTLPASIFYWADGVAIDAAGALYVTDTGNQVYKYSPTGTLLGQWATHTLSDPFSHPRGIAVDRTSGHVYVTNSDRNWVQKFTLAGANVTQWGTGPNGDGRLDSPSGLAVNQSSGDVYVADLSNNRVQRFSSTGNYLGQWGGTYGTGDGQFQWAEHVAVNSTSGDVYVTEQFAARIQRFSSTGAYLGQWGSFGSGDGQFNGGSNGIAVDTAGNVYVADRGNDRVQKFTATGTYLGQWGTTGSGAGQFQSPEAIAVDALTGNVYVAEWNRVQKFTSAGTYITQWQARSSGLAVDSAGNLFATDTFGARVRKFSPTGTPLARWGTYGSGNGQFQYPQGVAVGPSGNLYVADQGNNRIQRFAPTPGLAAQSERSWGEQAHPAPPKPETPTRSANPPDSRHDETDLLEARPALPYTLSWDN